MTLLGMLGMQDMILFLVAFLLLFGAKKVPELARGIGKAMGEFKKAREEFENEVTHAVKQAETEVIAPQPAAQVPVTKDASAAKPV